MHSSASPAKNTDDSRDLFPCTRLLKCLLASVLHHLEFASTEFVAAGDCDGAVVAKGCREVLCVAWRLAYCHWVHVRQSAGGGGSSSSKPAGGEAAAAAALSLCWVGRRIVCNKMKVDRMRYDEEVEMR